jgi:glycosyltransferase involved in cell wall biosynthesis
MSESIDTTVILPAYNEEEGLPLCLENLDKELRQSDENFEILVVDDGSGDRTAEVAAGYNCRLVKHKVNMGKGAAIVTGLMHARGRKIILIDADDTYPASEVPTLSRELDKVDLVLTSRTRENIPLLNIIGNRMISSLIRALSGFRGNDPLTGLYGLRRELIERIDIESRGFAVEAEIVVKASQMGATVKEIPIKYNPRAGQSKLKPFQDGFKIVRTILGLIVLYNPIVAFSIPGVILFTFGLVISALTFSGEFRVLGVALDIHSFIFGVMSLMVGFQMMVNGIVIDLYAIRHKLKKDDSLARAFTPKRIKSVIGAATISFVFGVILSLASVWSWGSEGFGAYFDTRKVISALFFTFFGLQGIFSGLISLVFQREYARQSSEDSWK